MTYSLYGKPAAGSAALFFVMNFNHLFQGLPLQAGLNLLLWVTFTVFLFLPRPRWTKVRIVLALCLLGIEIAAGVILYHEMKLLYFMAIFLFAAAIRMYVSKMQAPAMAVVLITAALYARFGRQDVFTLLSFVVFAAVLYFYIRSRIQRNEIYEQNKRHLAELQDAYDQLQQASATAMQYAVLEERTRIARDIHDAVGHSLTSLIVQMQALRFMVKKDPDQAEQSLKGMLAVARQGLQDIRTSVHALADQRSAPGMTVLTSLLNRMKDASGIGYTLNADIDDDELSAEGFELFYRVLQEAVTNVIRHSGATHVKVSLHKEEDCLAMRIRDNGAASSIDAIEEGFGLQVMKSRLSERGGELSLAIAHPSGLEIQAVIPCAGQDKKELEQEKEDCYAETGSH